MLSLVKPKDSLIGEIAALAIVGKTKTLLTKYQDRLKLAALGLERGLSPCRAKAIGTQPKA
jgi:hypothetical protein